MALNILTTMILINAIFGKYSLNNTLTLNVFSSLNYKCFFPPAGIRVDKELII
jgi:hypothetical protein